MGCCGESDEERNEGRCGGIVEGDYGGMVERVSRRRDGSSGRVSMNEKGRVYVQAREGMVNRLSHRQFRSTVQPSLLTPESAHSSSMGHDP